MSFYTILYFIPKGEIDIFLFYIVYKQLFVLSTKKKLFAQ